MAHGSLVVGRPKLKALQCAFNADRDGAMQLQNTVTSLRTDASAQGEFSKQAPDTTCSDKPRQFH